MIVILRLVFGLDEIYTWVIPDVMCTKDTRRNVWPNTGTKSFSVYCEPSSEGTFFALCLRFVVFEK